MNIEWQKAFDEQKISWIGDRRVRRGPTSCPPPPATRTGTTWHLLQVRQPPPEVEGHRQVPVSAAMAAAKVTQVKNQFIFEIRKTSHYISDKIVILNHFLPTNNGWETLNVTENVEQDD